MACELYLNDVLIFLKKIILWHPRSPVTFPGTGSAGGCRDHGAVRRGGAKAGLGLHAGAVGAPQAGLAKAQ